MMEDDLSNLSREELEAKFRELQQAQQQPSPLAGYAPDTDVTSAPSPEVLENAITRHFAKLALSPSAVTLLSSYLQSLRNDCLHLALAQLDVWQAVAGKEQ